MRPDAKGVSTFYLRRSGASFEDVGLSRLVSLIFLFYIICYTSSSLFPRCYFLLVCVFFYPCKLSSYSFSFPFFFFPPFLYSLSIISSSLFCLFYFFLRHLSLPRFLRICSLFMSFFSSFSLPFLHFSLLISRLLHYQHRHYLLYLRSLALSLCERHYIKSWSELWRL